MNQLKPVSCPFLEKSINETKTPKNKRNQTTPSKKRKIHESGLFKKNLGFCNLELDSFDSN